MSEPVLTDGNTYTKEEAEQILKLWGEISQRLDRELDPAEEEKLNKDIEALAILTKATLVNEAKSIMQQNNKKIVYEVYVDDNFHFMDEDERYKKGEYETEDEAIAVMKAIVDECIIPAYNANPTVSAESLYNGYTMFGDDPFCPMSRFSSWDYAKELCNDLCRVQPKQQAPIKPNR